MKRIIKITPSSADRVYHCPVSLMRSQGLKPIVIDNAVRDEGVLMHSIAEAYLKGGVMEASSVEMHNHACDYRKFIEDVCGTVKARMVEIAIEAMIDDEILVKGRPDYFSYDPHEKRLTIFDLKYGYQPVPAKGNKQLLTMAMAIIARMEKSEMGKPNLVQFAIFQPRAIGDPRSVHTYSIEEFLELYADFKSNIGDFTRVKVGSHCKYCPAQQECGEFSTLPQDIMSLMSPSPTGVSIELQYNLLKVMLPILKTRFEAIETEIASYIKSGKTFEGFALQDKYSRKQWKVPVNQVVAVGKAHGVDTSKVDVITPAQAIKAGIPAEVVDELSHKVQIGLELVTISELDLSDFYIQQNKGEVS